MVEPRHGEHYWLRLQGEGLEGRTCIGVYSDGATKGVIPGLLLKFHELSFGTPSQGWYVPGFDIPLGNADVAEIISHIPTPTVSQ